ncbi:DnaJ homolog subfamily C member 21, partial [Linum perenne]
MLRGGDNSIQETHYEILSVKEGASYEEIRSGYRSAILDSHPDKALNAPQSAGSKFLRVQKAWETLSDSRSRAAYDNELRSSRQQD